jgi:hypothetical protein
MRRTLITALSILLLTLAALPAAAGIQYKAVTTSQGEGGRSQTVVEGWVDGGKAKVVFSEAGTPGLRDGEYILTQDGGKTLYLVNPKEKTYAEWDLDAMLQMMGSMMQSVQPLINLEIDNVKVEPLGESAGPAMHGLSTTHRKYRTEYDMRIRVLGMKRANHVENVNEAWTTEEMNDAGLGIWLRNAPTTGFEDVDKLIKAEMSQAKGFPLKTTTTSTTTNKKGKSSTSTTTMEVTELDRNASIPAATFEIPEGYTRSESTLPAQGEGEEGGNPFGKLFGRGN